MMRSHLVGLLIFTLICNRTVLADEPEPLPDFPPPSDLVAPQQGSLPVSLTPAPISGAVDCCAGERCYVSLGVLFLDRELFGSTAIVTQDDGTPRFNSDDFGYRHEAGPRITVGKSIGCGSAVELHYFGLQRWSEGASVYDPTEDLEVPVGDLLDLEAFRDVEQVDMIYSSRLHNAEINWRQGNGATSWLIGVRYVNLSEDFSLVSLDEVGSPAGHGRFDVSTDNNMVGLQLGAETSLPVGRRVNFGVRGKAGIFVNFLDTDATISDPTAATTVSSSRSRADSACLLEGGLVLRYQVNQRVSLYAAYDVFYLDGIGLAVEQRVGANATGSALYHGPGAGVEVRW